MYENHYAKLQIGQKIRICNDTDFTCVYQGNKTFLSPCGKKYDSLRKFMIDNCAKREKTNTTGDAWKLCEKLLPNGNWVKCKKHVVAEAEPVVEAELVAEAEPIVTEAKPVATEETQLLLLNEQLQKQMDAIQKEKDIVVQRLKLLQTKREIEKIDAEIQILQEKRRALLQDNVFDKDTNKDKLKKHLFPYVERVFDKLLETNNIRDLSKFLAPIAELFVLDRLKQNGFNACEAKDVCGLGASHDLEIIKNDGSVVNVQVKGRADKNWGIMTGKKHYHKTDFDLLAYLHYETMGDLSSAKLWYFPVDALTTPNGTLFTKVPAAALQKYCNKDAQEELLHFYF